ncbi:MAG: VOC family protein [Deltaproteobacteria bacterium]|nr:VOC family protein [Deltaproteobacteria bacterium]
MSEKIAVNFVDHISIAVKDVLKAEADYCRYFGWDVAERYHDDDAQINVSCFALGPTTLEIMEDVLSGGWYELQDKLGSVVIRGPGAETKWAKKRTTQPEGQMGPTGDWIANKNKGREGIQVVSFNVDNVLDATEKFKGNGGQIVPYGGSDVQHWKEPDRNYTFLHPKPLHGIVLEFIDGAYAWKKN